MVRILHLAIFLHIFHLFLAIPLDKRLFFRIEFPDGNVIIHAKDVRGKLLEKVGGQLKSNMSERDLIYFEQMLPKLQPKKHQEVSKSHSHQVASNSLER